MMYKIKLMGDDMPLDPELTRQIRNNEIVSLTRSDALSYYDELIKLLSKHKCTQIIKVDMPVIWVDIEHTKQFIKFTKILKGFTLLETVNFAHNTLGDKAVCKLTKSLSKCINLEAINLSHTQIHDKAIVALCKILPSLPYLTSINFGGNVIDTAGVGALVKVMPLCHALTKVSLLGCHMTPQQIEEIALSISPRVTCKFDAISIENDDYVLTGAVDSGAS